MDHPPRIAAIELTSRCNWDCGFCISTDDNVEKRVEESKRIIDDLPPSIKTIVFVGGEPTLHRGLWLLCAHAKGKGYTTKVHTNGWLVKKWTDDELAVVDVVNLPIGSMDEKTNDAMRNRGAMKMAMKNIDYLTSRSKKVSITTIVTKKNLHSLPALRDYLATKPIVSWKIFKFYPKTGNGNRHREEFEITDKEFDAAVDAIELPNAKTYKIRDFKKFETATFY